MLSRLRKSGAGFENSKGRSFKSISSLCGIRRVNGDTIEDMSGDQFAVWEVAGCDPNNNQVLNGWLSFINSLDTTVQILVRQQFPGLCRSAAALP